MARSVPSRSKVKPPSHTETKRQIRRNVYVLGLIFAWGIILGGAILAYYLFTLPNIDALWKQAGTPQLQIFDSRHTLLTKGARRRRVQISYEDLPIHLVLAVLAIEDRQFFIHNGIDIRGLGRAFLANIRAGEVVAGGSTITQQLAKNVFLHHQRTFARKIRELILALWLEARFDKREIFTLYLNRVYFGAGAYGIHAASDIYFSRHPQQLSLQQAALLAGLLKAPSQYTPTHNRAGAIHRAELVLAAMHDAGFISADVVRDTDFASMAINSSPASSAHYALDWIYDILPNYIGTPDGNIDIFATIDADMQSTAEAVLHRQLATHGARLNVGEAALIAMTPDGAIRALVGGHSYRDSQFNRAIYARRQPGSAFKPIVYLTGLRAGLNPRTQLIDAPITIEGWSPRNYDNNYHGTVSIADAFAHSLNTVAVRVSEYAGRDNVIDMARSLGIYTPLAPHPSIALGSFEVTLLDLTAAYASFANGGYPTFPYIIENVIAENDLVIYDRRAGVADKIITSNELSAITKMMRGVIEFGTGQQAQMKNVEIAGKTGTSQNWRDAWFIGFSGELVVGVWLGNDDGSPTHRVSGGSLPAMIWHDFMTSAPHLTHKVPLFDRRGGGRK